MTGKISRQETRILIVDDDHEYMSYTRESLEQDGYREFEDCTNGNDAIRLAREYKPHVILMRTKLSRNNWETQPETPKTHGYVACREIRKESYGLEIAIIGISRNENDNEKWRKADSDNFMVKKGLCAEIDGYIKTALEKYGIELEGD